MPVQNKFSLFSSPTSVSDRIFPSVVIVRTTFHTAILRDVSSFKPPTVCRATSANRHTRFRPCRRQAALLLQTPSGDLGGLLSSDEMVTANESHWPSVMARANDDERPPDDWPRVSATQKKLPFLLRSSIRDPRTSRGGGGDCYVGRTGPSHVRTDPGRERNCARWLLPARLLEW